MPEPSPPPFEILDHTADVLLRVYGRDPEDLFRNALGGLYAVLGEIVPSDAAETRTVTLTADRREDLLHDWISEALYWFDTRREIAREVAFSRLTDTSLDADVLFTKADLRRSTFHREVKAVTYHELAVTRAASFWTATLVLDL